MKSESRFFKVPKEVPSRFFTFGYAPEDKIETCKEIYDMMDPRVRHLLVPLLEADRYDRNMTPQAMMDKFMAGRYAPVPQR
jgi:hypothetical protein